MEFVPLAGAMPLKSIELLVVEFGTTACETGDYRRSVIGLEDIDRE